MGLGRLLLVVIPVVIIAVVMVLSLNLILHRPFKLRNSVGSPISESALVIVDVPVYVVGPQSLIQKLISVGVNQSLIRPVTISELPSLPGNSLVVIDWSVVGPNLVVNRNGVVFVNANSTAFNLIEGLIRRGDFMIIHGNSSTVPIIEYALALAWSRAFNTNITAIPIPKYLGDLNYVIAFGNNHALVIGPHILTAALQIANNVWTPIIMKEPPADPADPCYVLAFEYSIPSNTPTQISTTAYAIVYGKQIYTDSFGTAYADFCLTWSTKIDMDLNGAAVSWARLYNFISYVPGSGTSINYLKSFQDSVASYMVYEYESGEIGLSQLPGDVVYIAGTGNGYNPGYWTDSGGQDPGSQTCTTSYSIGLTVGYSSSGPSSLTIACPGDTITLNPAGIATTVTQLGAAINNTWIMKPMQTANTQQNTLATDSWGAAYMGPAYNPQPTAYTIPAGVLAKLGAGRCGFLDLFTRHVYVSYYLDWLVWVNMTSFFGRPGRLPIYIYYGNGLGPGNLTSDGFYIETWCG